VAAAPPGGTDMLTERAGVSVRPGTWDAAPPLVLSGSVLHGKD